MLDIVMIRHFATKGNLEKKYIGTTDQPLCKEGREEGNKIKYPEVEWVVSSPLKRCLETAGIIYPHQNTEIIMDLRECDFGDFENKNYKELENNPDYQKWIDSMGTLDFPGGEGVEAFKGRTLRAFLEIVNKSIEKGYQTIGLIVHGGTIMSILDQYCYPHQDYYHWQVKNGEGYRVSLEKTRLEDMRINREHIKKLEVEKTSD